jgi:hypothetical protein
MEENLIEAIPPSPMVKEIHTETSSLRTLKIMPRNLNVIVRSCSASGCVTDGAREKI